MVTLSNNTLVEKMELGNHAIIQTKNHIEPRSLHIVPENGMYGYASQDCHIVIPEQFQESREFETYQHAVVKKDGFYGLINKIGETIIPFMYENVNYIERGNIDSSYIIVTKEKKRGVVNLKNEIIIPIDYDSISLEGIDSLYFRVKQNNKYGLFNHEGKLELPIIYDSIHQLFECDLFRLELNNKYGLTNCKGLETGLICEYIGEGFEEFIRVQQNKKWGFINHDLEWVIAPIYERAWDFIDEYSLVKDCDEWYFLVVMDDLDMDYLIDHEIEHYLQTSTHDREYDEQKYLVQIPMQVGLKDINLFDSFVPYKILLSENGLYVNQETYSHTNDLRETCLVPIDIDDVEIITEEKYTVVRKDGKYGVINFNGEFMIPCIYDKIINNGKQVKVNMNGIWDFVDVSKHL